MLGKSLFKRILGSVLLALTQRPTGITPSRLCISCGQPERKYVSKIYETLFMYNKYVQWKLSIYIMYKNIEIEQKPFLCIENCDGQYGPPEPISATNLISVSKLGNHIVFFWDWPNQEYSGEIIYTAVKHLRKIIVHISF